MLFASEICWGLIFVAILFNGSFTIQGEEQPLLIRVPALILLVLAIAVAFRLCGFVGEFLLAPILQLFGKAPGAMYWPSVAAWIAFLAVMGAKIRRATPLVVLEPFHHPLVRLGALAGIVLAGCCAAWLLGLGGRFILLPIIG